MNQEYIGKVPHQLFEQQVSDFADAVAVFTENQSLTYAELNRKANQLAHYLIETLGIRPGDTIGVCTDHEPDRVLSLIAINKAGATYVPIDPFYPADLINYMTNKIGCKYILVNRPELAQKESELSAGLVPLRAVDYGHYSTKNPDLAVSIHDAMYIIFTSGSTGRPKAVAVSFSAAYNHFSWVMDYTQFSTADIWLQTINPSFDPSMHELMAPLMIGGRIALIGGTRKLDSREIADAIIRLQATHITSVPTMLTLMVDTPNFSQCTSLKHVCVGGEVFRPALGQKAMSLLPNTQFHNVYGPTEATIMASGWNIVAPETRDALPIGPAIYNMKFYIQTDEGVIRDLAPGAEGQLCISGVSLANGYVNDEALTNEKFIINPLEPNPESLYHRLYFSGDRVRVDEQGEIYCLGRLDDQVKINGQRVELAEIEYQFSTFNGVKDVAALLIDGDLNVVLATSEPENTQRAWLEDIKAQAMKKLSAIMIPKRMKIIESVPRQAVSAKADRKKLIELLSQTSCDLEQLKQKLNFDKPIDIEESLTQIVMEIISHTDSLDNSLSFADIGFDSVDLQMLSLRVGKHFNCDLRTEDLFEYYTIEKLSDFIKSQAVVTVEL